MNRKVIKRIEEIFKEKLQAKTSWGRKDVEALHQESVNEALMELLD